LASVRACSLVSGTEAQQAVPGIGAAQDMGARGGSGTSDCRWDKSAVNGHGGVTFGVTVRPTQALTEFVVTGGELTSGTAGSHKANLIKNNEGPGSCAMAIAVGSGRVDITTAVSTADTTDDACAVVNKVSDIVEPKLPAA
jgi:hypothetical protein